MGLYGLLGGTLGHSFSPQIHNLLASYEYRLFPMPEEDVEPFFLEHLGTIIPRELYMELRFMLLNRCREIWENQHSVMGLIDTLLLAIGSLSEEDKKEAEELIAKTEKIIVRIKTTLRLFLTIFDIIFTSLNLLYRN